MADLRREGGEFLARDLVFRVREIVVLVMVPVRSWVLCL